MQETLGSPPRSIRQIVGRELVLPQGAELQERIAGLRQALRELRTDNERNSHRLACGIAFAALLGGLFMLPGMMAIWQLLLGPQWSIYSNGILMFYCMKWLITWQLPFELFALHAYQLVVWGADQVKFRKELEENLKLDRIKRLNGSGLAELLLSGDLDEEQCMSVFRWPRRLYMWVGRIRGSSQELMLFLSALDNLIRQPAGGSHRKIGLNWPLTLILVVLVPAAYQKGAVEGHFTLAGLLLVLPAIVIANANIWRARFPLLDEYLERCLDFYAGHGSLELPEEQLAIAPPEILGTRLPLSMEALCGELRKGVVNGRFGEVGAAHLNLLWCCGISLLGAVVMLASSPGLPLLGGKGLLLLAGGLLAVPVMYTSFFSMLKRLRTSYRARIRSRGLFEQLISGTLPVRELEESSPVWLRDFLHQPSVPEDVDNGLGRNAWLLMWNVDWFLRGEGSSIRWDWSMRLSPLYLLCLLQTVHILADPGRYALPPDYDGMYEYWLWMLAIIPLGLALSYVSSYVLLRHRAAALAMLDVLEERLLPVGGGEAT
ncbi:MAG: hypothetical protein R3F46_15905 [bacterium]